MRIPLVRFGGEDCPMEPWEDRLAPVVLPVIVPLLFAAIMLMSAVGVALFLGWAAVSPILPRPWRLNWDTAFDLNPSVHAECPACRTRLTLGPVDRRGRVLRTNQGREIIRPAQRATCPQCRRAFSRFSLGKVWSSWHEVPDAEPVSWPRDFE